MWRIACLRIPRFPLGALWRAAQRPAPVQLTLDLAMAAPVPAPTAPTAPTLHWDAQPRALVDGQRLTVVSEAAARAGVRAGMRLPEARARVSTLAVQPVDEALLARAITETTAALLAASPQVTPAAGAAGTWWIGVPVGGTADRARLATFVETVLTVARRWHPDARVGIADSCVAARAATWSPVRRTPARAATPRVGQTAAPLPAALDDPAVTLIPPGGCAAFLAPAPLGLVPMDADLRAALEALGLRTLGAFAALEAGDVEARWGAGGLASWRLARGDDPRRPGLTRVEAPRAVHAELPHPAETVTPVGFLVRAALERLVADLVRDGRSAAAVAITLELDVARHNTEEHLQLLLDPPTAASREQARAASGVRTSSHLDGWDRATRTITREVRPARPLARVEPLVEQCRSLLERWTLPAAVTGVTVHIPATAPLAADQGDLLLPSWRDMAASADGVLSRLTAALDPDGRGDVVVHPEAADAHRYDRAGTWIRAEAWTLAEQAERSRVRETMARDVIARDATPGDAGVVTRDVTPAEHGATSPNLEHAALRLLELPEVVTVLCANGVPRVLEWRGVRQTLTRATGPERLTGDWWRHDAFAREYWRCRIDGEGDVLVYQEGAAWRVQGWFD
jgi:nucleotidyltransferase/DNA polymerase involved in DNA repair